jgi:gliding motility-associated protein GldM
MINIMYLVLTAMLALNVSAEIFNAFKIVDKGLVKSNKALAEANNKLPEAIRDGAKKKRTLETYAERITPSRDLSKKMYDRLETMMNDLIDAGGNADGQVNDEDYVLRGSAQIKELKGKKNKDITTRILVKDGEGEKLKSELLKFREDILALVDEEDRESFTKEIPAIVDDEAWKQKASTKKRSNYDWATFNFKQMPLQAVIPILRKFQNDVKSTESSFLNYLATKVGTTTDVVLDRFTVVSAPEKTYIINGEQFSTDVFMSASASAESNTGVTIKVNGRQLPVNDDGVATFATTASGVGKKSYEVEASIRNPVTDEIQTFRRTYEYEVGERSAAISATKMNVFYIGVENPVEVSVAGVPSSSVNVGIGGQGGGKISTNGDGTYTVNVTGPPTAIGEFASVNVSAPGFSASKNFRVKRIPDPVPKLSKSRGGRMGSGEFKAQGGIIPALDNFDFDAKCDIIGFNLVRVPRRQDPEIAVNRSGSYIPDARRIIEKARPGDRFFFENIKCRCPGDPAARDIGTMTFVIN